jgi:zinc transport system substrate-binding protein
MTDLKLSRMALWTATFVALTLLVGCGAEPVETEPSEQPEVEIASDSLSVYVVNYPLSYFAGRIGADRVEVTFPVPAGVDPAYWEPTTDEVIAYQGADLILLNGAGYARWASRATLPAGKLVDTSAAVGDRFVPLEASTVHSHGPEGEHSHKGTAFTTWLDPGLAVEQARAVSTALGEALPEHAELFRANLEELEADLASLDGRLTAASQALESTPILFSHPVYQYLIARYGLEGRSLHWEPDTPPDDGAWRELEAILAEQPVEWMLWEAQPLGETEERLRELGVRSLVFDPCANTPEQGDYMSVMEANAAALEALDPRSTL